MKLKKDSDKKQIGMYFRNAKPELESKKEDERIDQIK
jgi:hypothetical protein